MPDSDDHIHDEHEHDPNAGDMNDEHTTPDHKAASEDPIASPLRRPAVIATAIALPVALVIGVLVAAVMVARSPVVEPIALGTVDAPDADSAACGSVLGALPEDLGDYTRAELVDPAPVGARAWASDVENAEPVVLRCGLPRPIGFDVASPLQVIDDVQWFEVSGSDDGIDATTWFVVDRDVYIALTLPGDSGPTPLQDASAAIAGALEQQPLDPAPLR